MKVKNIKILIILLLIGGKLSSQELNLDVRINTPSLSIADPKVFRTLETSLKEFMNNTSWTDHQFDATEKIEGSLQINIKEDKSTNTFVADFYVTASRPVFESNYYSTLINHVDRGITFSYEEYQPLFNNKSSFSDNLSAILTYYAYVILGFDYDSFSPFGGDPYFTIAKNIVESIPPSISGRDKAWVAVGSDRNRYWLVENILNPRVKPYRKAYYEYHRRGLDVMSKDSEKGKLVLLSSLKVCSDVNKTYPNSMILQMFTDSKKQEVLDIFVPAKRGDRLKVYNIMTTISPSQVSEYTDLRS